MTRVDGGLSGAAGRALVIDTGVDLDHPDLNVDVALSSAFNATRDKDADDGNDHGTHVAGTIAAIKGNGIGVVGVAPGTTVVGIKVLDRRGSGSNSGVIAEVEYASASPMATTSPTCRLAASSVNAERCRHRGCTGRASLRARCR